MSKVIINLDKWGMLNYGDCFCAFGIADNHPKLGKNVIVSHTSKILKVNEITDAYEFETHNSIYVCKLGNICNDIPYEFSKTTSKSKVAKVYNKYYRYMLYKIAKHNDESINKYGIRLKEEEAKEFERLLELKALCNKEREEKVKLHEAELLEEASKYDNCIFIDLSSISQGSPAAFNINGRTGIINPTQHIGMFTDTVLYINSDDKDNYIDFRYYVRFLGLEIYSWTKNIENVVIHNSKGSTISFNRCVKIEPDETIIINRNTEYERLEACKRHNKPFTCAEKSKVDDLDDLFK